MNEVGVRSALWLKSFGMGGGVDLWKPDVAARPDDRPAWRTDCIVGLLRWWFMGGLGEIMG